MNTHEHTLGRLKRQVIIFFLSSEQLDFRQRNLIGFRYRTDITYMLHAEHFMYKKVTSIQYRIVR